MATAMAFPEAAKGGDRKSSCFKQLDFSGFDKSLLSRARYVLRNSPMGIAGITPPIIITDIDPKLAVHRSNNQNRDATPGQKAMATAMAFPEAKRGMHSELKNLTGSAKVYLSQARYVLRNSPMVEGERYPRRCLSTNVHRRHLTKGQQAMAVALAYPNPEQGKRETSLKIKEVGINAGYISQARFIIRHCLDKAEEVLLNPNYTLNKRGSLWKGLDASNSHPGF